MRIRVEAPIQHTEDPAKVVAACQALLDGEVTVVDGAAVGQGTDVDTLRQRIWELRIIDTMRGTLLAGCDGDRTRFMLSKQAAAAGKVSIPIGAALGDIQVEIAVEPGDGHADAEALCWWICPETKDGEVVGPTG